MLFLLSPAKTLDFESPLGDLPHSAPHFTPRAAQLIDVLRGKTPHELSQLMHISESLAVLNAARYQAWRVRAPARAARQAVLAFNGDVYDGLQARSMATSDLQWAQRHLCILSGLYGVLRPLDLMQPYRLEMGTVLQVGPVRNLYEFWSREVTDHLNRQLRADATPVVINLASQEYFKVIDVARLKARTVECVFEDWKDGRFKLISFFAKKARGAMARYATANRVATPGELRGFDLDGYAYAGTVSTPDRLVFRRKIQA